MVTTRRAPKQHALVTGGSGFVGRHLVQQLVASGLYRVTVFDVRAVNDSSSGGEDVSYFIGDLRSKDDLRKACTGVDVVFHVAAAAPTNLNAAKRDLMTSINVDGTRNLIEACLQAKVPKLVYTSSASVVFEGRDLKGVDETTPYARHPIDYYSHTKIQGECLVLAANGVGGLATCAIRPSSVFGEYDQLLVPTTVEKAKQGKMKYIIGTGDNLMDWTYAGNVAQAHILAAERLFPSSPVAGQAYFVTNNEDCTFWGFMGDLCEGLGYGRPRIRLPFWLVYLIALLVAYVVTPLLRPFKELHSDFTPARIKLAAANRKFSVAKAQRDLGYQPAVSLKEGLARTLAHFRHLHADAAPNDMAGGRAKAA